MALPFAPRAVVCWWVPAAPSANRGGIGFATAGSSVGDAPIVVDESGITLRSTEPAHVHCLALGGADVGPTAVGMLAAPAVPGQQTVELGFRPDLLLVAATPGSGVSFGAAAAGGSQAVTAFASVDGAVGGCQRIGAAIAAPETGDSKGVSALARVASFDPHGVTLDWSGVDGIGSAAYLALAGGSYEVGVDVMPRRTKIRTTSLVRTAPAAVLMSSWGLYGGDETRRIARVSLGAASSPRDAGSVVWAERLARSSATSVVQVADTSPGAASVHAEAMLKRLRRRGFTLEWPRNEGRRPRQFFYVAFGTPLRPSLRSALRRALRRVRRSLRALTTR